MHQSTCNFSSHYSHSVSLFFFFFLYDLGVQVILKQQRVIKRLLKKCYGSDFASTRTNPAALADEAESVELALEGLTSLVQQCDGDGQGSLGSDGSYNKIDFEQDAQNDSDSAIMLEDNLAEVSIGIDWEPN